MFEEKFGACVKLNCVQVVLNAELWVQFKDPPCISCAKWSTSIRLELQGATEKTLLRFFHPVCLCSFIYCRFFSARFVPCGVSELLQERSFLLANPSSSRGREGSGCVCVLSCFSFFLFHHNVLRLWKPLYVLLIISCQLVKFINCYCLVLWLDATNYKSWWRSTVGFHFPQLH